MLDELLGRVHQVLNAVVAAALQDREESPPHLLFT